MLEGRVGHLLRGVVVATALGFGALSFGLAAPARALDVLLDDVAPDRVERQRAFARGELPLPGTPALEKLDERLAARGLAKGRAIYLRIFKAESELEVWLQNARGTFTLLDTYPICHWTGTIGPKLKEGDKQSPEGFYSVGMPQTRLVGRWRRAFNLGFPNRHDQLLERTGSYILIHGGCSSVGCFAMTDLVQNEIYGLADAALRGGQSRFQVHIFPFRMTPANMREHADHAWAHTWADLKPAYDSFERTRIPPMVALCGMRYLVADGLPGETGAEERRLQSIKPEPTGLPSDPAAVTDVQGNWLPPACKFDDDAQRSAGLTPTSSVTTSASAAAPRDDGVAGAVASPVKSPSLERQRKTRLVHRRSNGGDAKAAAPEPVSDAVGGTANGFGSAHFSGQRPGKPAGG